MRKFLLAGIVAMVLPLVPAAAQTRAETLADIRQQLSSLYVDIQSLRSELTTSGGLTSGIAGSTPLDRMNTIEAELQRLTLKTEELEFRINRITVDGTNRIGDLEFRLCELEEGCDISLLGDTPSLGGIDNSAVVPVPAPPPATGGPSLAVGEQADFDRASAAFNAGEFRAAADQFGTFVQTYPGGPLTARASFMRGEALESLGDIPNAARAYLESFSNDQTGPVAPDALFKLGMALALLGQNQDACITLSEVGIRFPGNEAEADARSAMQSLACQ